MRVEKICNALDSMIEILEEGDAHEVLWVNKHVFCKVWEGSFSRPYDADSPAHIADLARNELVNACGEVPFEYREECLAKAREYVLQLKLSDWQ